MTTNTVPATWRDAIAAHLRAYLGSGGAQGHMVNGAAAGGHAISMNCMIRYKGRKSGDTFITPLCYSHVGGEVGIAASKGGAAEHPAWYLNLREAPEIDFQIATQAFRAKWREPIGVEREKAWGIMVDNYPFYAAYQASTTRLIPLVMMKPLEEIPVFKTTDITGKA
jgi:deazaflavin-dependent oxidoreductase (nitroreductase family)